MSIFDLGTTQNTIPSLENMLPLNLMRNYNDIDFEEYTVDYISNYKWWSSSYRSKLKQSELWKPHDAKKTNLVS